jgi:hypothetical protein
MQGVVGYAAGIVEAADIARGSGGQPPSSSAAGPDPGAEAKAGTKRPREGEASGGNSALEAMLGCADICGNFFFFFFFLLFLFRFFLSRSLKCKRDRLRETRHADPWYSFGCIHFTQFLIFCLSSDDPLQRRILKLQATRGRKSGSVAGYVLWVIFFFFSFRGGFSFGQGRVWGIRVCSSTKLTFEKYASVTKLAAWWHFRAAVVAAAAAARTWDSSIRCPANGRFRSVRAGGRPQY